MCAHIDYMNEILMVEQKSFLCIDIIEKQVGIIT